MSDNFLSEYALNLMMDTRYNHRNGELRSTIARDTDANGAYFPNLQILTIRQISREGGSVPRYPVTISDGHYQSHGLLSPNLNHLIDDGFIHENCVISVNEFFAHAPIEFGATLIVILDCDVLYSHSQRIGNPVPLYWYREDTSTEQDDNFEDN